MHQTVLDESHLVLLGYSYDCGRSQLVVFDFSPTQPLCHKHQLKRYHELSGYKNLKLLNYFPLYNEEPNWIRCIHSYVIRSGGMIHVASRRELYYAKMCISIAAGVWLYAFRKDLCHLLRIRWYCCTCYPVWRKDTCSLTKIVLFMKITLV